MPYSGTERALRIFKIKKRIQLVKKIRLSTHIDNFDKNNFSFFLERGSKNVF